MSSNAIATVIKMMETLPDPVQERVVEHLREYLQELDDEQEWDSQFENTRAGLVAAARRARKEIAEGLAKPLNPDEL